MVNTPTFVRKMYTTVDAGLMANKSENQLILTAVNITTVTNSTKDIVTHHPLSQKHDGMWKNDLQEVSLSSLSLAKELILNINFQELKQFRSGKTGLIQDDYILVKPTLHWKKFNRYINKNKIDKSLPAYNVEYNNSGVTANDGMYQMDTGYNFCLFISLVFFSIYLNFKQRFLLTIDIKMYLPTSEKNKIFILYISRI